MHHRPFLLYRAFAAACLACASLTAWAGNVQVQVLDSNGKAVADAAVFLDSPAAKALAKPMGNVEIAQISKQFTPQLSVVTTGSQVLFPNRDTVRHHVYSFSPAKTFELKLYAGVPANPVLFDRSGIVVLGCNIHDTMTAWVLVVDTPYFGKTDTAGRVTLPAVAPGRYTMRTWHTSFPVGAAAQEQPLQVEASGATAQVTLTGAKR